MWNQELLQKTISERMSDYQLIIASNRQPYRHEIQSEKIVCYREPGGLVTAMDPVMRALKGLWIASGTSEYDFHVVDQHSKVMVPEKDSGYCLKRIGLSKEEKHGYYYGFSNEGLWPLCHVAYTRPFFKETDWQYYQQVNKRFAEAILKEAGNRPAFVWIQDFHLALVPKYLKESGNSNIISSIFWHIPWPNPEVFKICPQKKEILEGMLAADLIGFQIKYHGENFLATIDAELESRIDRERVSVFYQQKETLIRHFPISVDFQSISESRQKPETLQWVNDFRRELHLENKKLILGVDRLDYTKGIPERLKAIDRCLDKYPELKQKFVFLQIGQISRIHLHRYKQLNDEINALVEEINWKHSEGSWMPIRLTRRQYSYNEILNMCGMADVCMVSSLHDGMNLVAKEYVASHFDEKGVLLLSLFTGAARELTDALLINPFDSESFADSIYQALSMPVEEQTRRMKKMRDIVAHQNIYRWVGKVLSQLLKFEFQEA